MPGHRRDWRASARQPAPPTAVPPGHVVGGDQQLTVTLRRHGGVLMVPALLNDSASADFVVDSGASDVVIPETVLQDLRKAGKFSDADFTGTQMVKIADGSIVKVRDLHPAQPVGQQPGADQPPCQRRAGQRHAFAGPELPAALRLVVDRQRAPGAPAQGKRGAGALIFGAGST